MARYRTIKPEFWTSEQVMECTPMARLLFIGTWNFADDAGRHPFSPKQLKAEIFPSDNITSENVLGMLLELSKNGLIVRYTIDNRPYFYIKGWHHQRIDKPQKPKYPAPLGNGGGSFQDYSENDLGPFVPGIEGNRREKEAAVQNSKPK